MKKFTNEWEVLTDGGFVSFDGIKKTNGKTIKLTFNDNSHIECSWTHKLMVENNLKKAIHIKVGDKCTGKKVISKVFMYRDKPLYDLLNTGDKHLYLTNGITSSNCAFIPDTHWKEFKNSVFPTISSGKESRIILVSTFNGENHFSDAWMTAEQGKSAYHPERVDWWDVPGRDEAWKELMLKDMTQEDFDQEYGNVALGSSLTLLSAHGFEILQRQIQDPLQSTIDTKIYEEPIKGHKYIISCDCASDGCDYSAFSVIDITSMPYKQVATYYNNKVSHLQYPTIISTFGYKYNNADVLIESNEIGQTILHILNYELEYENIIKVKNGQQIKMGVRTTAKSKNIGCNRLKELIERNKLIIPDKNTQNELKVFSLKGTSYEAEQGYHDDLVMSLVIFSYFYNTPTFNIMYDQSAFGELRTEYEKELEESLTPLPIFSANFSDDDGIPLGLMY